MRISIRITLLLSLTLFFRTAVPGGDMHTYRPTGDYIQMEEGCSTKSIVYFDTFD